MKTARLVKAPGALAGDDIERASPQSESPLLGFGDQSGADALTPPAGLDEQVLKFGIAVVSQKDSSKAGYDAVLLGDENGAKMRIGDMPGFVQRLQLLDMVAPGERRPQLDGFEPGLVLRPRGPNGD